MRAQKITFVVIALILLAILLCQSYAQIEPKEIEIKPGTTVQWPDKDTVIITTTVSQQVSKERLLSEQQQLRDRITQLQGEVNRLQTEAAYLDLILASCIDPNEP